MKRNRGASVVPMASIFLSLRSAWALTALAGASAVAASACGDDMLAVLDRATGGAAASGGNGGAIGGAAGGAGNSSTTAGGAFADGSSGSATTGGTGWNWGTSWDAGAEAGASGIFGPPKLIAALSDPNDDDEDPALSSDGLELYFASTRAGTFDIWVSERAIDTDPWGPPERVDELSSDFIDRSPGLSWDGLTMWFASTRVWPAGGAFAHIWMSTRPARGAPWTPPIPVPELSSSSNDFGPSIDKSGLRIFLSSTRSGNSDLYVATRASTSQPTWGTPTPVTELNTADGEWDPFIAGDGLQIFWTVWGVSKPQHISWARRATVDGQFANTVVLGELGFGSFDPALSADLQQIVFVLLRGTDTELFEATRR